MSFHQKRSEPYSVPANKRVKWLAHVSDPHPLARKVGSLPPFDSLPGATVGVHMEQDRLLGVDVLCVRRQELASCRQVGTE